MAAAPSVYPILDPSVKMQVYPSYSDRTWFNFDWKTIGETSTLFPRRCMVTEIQVVSAATEGCKDSSLLQYY